MVCIVIFTEQSKDTAVPDCSAVSICGLTSGSHEGSTERQPGQHYLYHVLCCVFLLCKYIYNGVHRVFYNYILVVLVKKK